MKYTHSISFPLIANNFDATMSYYYILSDDEPNPVV